MFKDSSKIGDEQVYLTDYHVHCDYSIDAVGTIDEYCRAALKKGLVEICFTTHYDGNPKSEGDAGVIRVKGKDLPATPKNLEPYVNDVLSAHDKYYPQGLSVKLGLEFGWFPGAGRVAEVLRSQFGFDYMLCGIHELDNLCFCCSHCYEKCFGRYSVEEAVTKYRELIVEAAGCDAIDTIAHLDYIRKYGLEYYGPRIDDLLLEECEKSVFASLLASDTKLEINTSAMRRGFKDYFPRLPLLNAAKRAGVDIRYLGSDAHEPEHVGFDFEVAAALIPLHVAGCEG